MADHASALRVCFAPFGGLNPDVAGLDGCASLFSYLNAKKMIAEKYSAGHLLRIQQALEERGLDSTYSAPGAENPADELTKVRGDMAPLLRLWESGHFNPGSV